MNRSSKILYTLMALSPIVVFAEEFYDGNFVHYEGAEYESTFIPCGSDEVWSVLEGPIQQILVARAMATDTKEITVSLSLDVTPIDKIEYPQSHYSGTVRVLRMDDSRDVACTDAYTSNSEYMKKAADRFRSGQSWAEVRELLTTLGDNDIELYNPCTEKHGDISTPCRGYQLVASIPLPSEHPSAGTATGQMYFSFGPDQVLSEHYYEIYYKNHH